MDLRDRVGDVEKGLRIVSCLNEVMQYEAGDEVRAVYDGVQANLRVPFINFLFRILANYPTYLTFAWNKLEPYLLTTDFEGAADELRARALIEPISDTTDVDCAALGDLARIRSFVDSIHYVVPKLLLVVSALDEGVMGESGEAANRTREIIVKPGVVEGTTVLPMVSSSDTGGKLRTILEDIKDRHGHPDVASYYRALANWPPFLEAAWERVIPLVGSSAYAARKHQLLENAREHVLQLPLPNSREAIERGVKVEQLEEIRAILALFRFRIIPETLLEISLVKAHTDGPEATRSSRFSFLC